MRIRALWPGEMAKYYEQKCNPGGVTAEEHAWSMQCLNAQCEEERARVLQQQARLAEQHGEFAVGSYIHIGMTYLLQALAGLATGKGVGRDQVPVGRCTEEFIATS